MKPGALAIGHGVFVVKNWDSGGETENSGSGIGDSGGGPSPLEGSGGGIIDSEDESKLVTKPWLGRWSWSLGGESRKDRGSGGETAFSS